MKLVTLEELHKALIGKTIKDVTYTDDEGLSITTHDNQVLTCEYSEYEGMTDLNSGLAKVTP